MTGYFYPASRAHHAHCMAIDFGMKFVNTKGQLWEPEGLLHITVPGYKIEVAEVSLHLLETIIGDLWGSPRVTGIVIHESTNMVTLQVPERHNGKTHFVERKDGGKIIQRNGNPFHWPERTV